MESDIRSTKLTASGSIFGGPARVKAMNIVFGASAGSVVLRDGGSGGTIVMDLPTPNNASSSDTYIILPGAGIRCSTNAYATLTNVTAVTFFYA